MSAASRASGYGRGARILSVGIATTGVVTFAYFSVASHVLDDDQYASISLLWSVLFVTVSVIYRPVEQLLSRTIADRRARGLHDHALRTPLLIQGAFALALPVVALALRGPIQDGLFDGSAALYWILFVAVLAYAASYFARGWLAGHQWFALYGGARVPRGDVAAAVRARRRRRDRRRGRPPSRSAWRRRRSCRSSSCRSRSRAGRAGRPGAQARPTSWRSRAAGASRSPCWRSCSPSRRCSTRRCSPTDLTADDAAVAGFVFNVLLIARAPLQLFQAVQGSLLPHLAGLEARAGREEARRAVRITVLAIAGFSAAVAIGLVAIGPWAMDLLFDDGASYGRWGLALVALGMGFHLMAGTLNQAALARDDAAAAAAAWLVRRRHLRHLARRAGRRRPAPARRARLPRRGRPALRRSSPSVYRRVG